MNTTRLKMVVQTKMLDANRGTFVGLGASYAADSAGDRIMRGAFTKSLAVAQARKRASGSPYLYPLLWKGDPTLPLGGVISAEETTDGLRLVCQCDLSTKFGQAAFSGIQAGYLSGFELGISRVTSTGRDAFGNNAISEVGLMSVSLAAIGYGTGAIELEEKSSMNRRNRDDVSSQRVPLAPYHHPETPQVPDVPVKPDRLAYLGDDLRYAEAVKRWEKDMDTWDSASHRASGLPTPLEANRTAEQAEREAALARAADERASRPGASASDLADYYRKHGRTPDGRTIEDTSATITRAYEAMMQRIADADK